MSGISQAVKSERLAAIARLSPDHSQTEIGKILGIGRDTVGMYQRSLGISQRVERGIRHDKKSPYEVKTIRQAELAKAAARRMTDGLSEINGICRGMKDLDTGMVVAGLGEEDALVWMRKAKALSSALNDFHKQLKEVIEYGAEN